MRARGEEPLWPPNPAPYLTDWLLDLGPSVAGAMGEGPMAIRHIAADLEALGIDAEPWELRLLRGLSEVWCDERVSARKPGRLPPYGGEAVGEREIVRSNVDKQFAGMARMFSASAGKKKGGGNGGSDGGPPQHRNRRRDRPPAV